MLAFIFPKRHSFALFRGKAEWSSRARLLGESFVTRGRALPGTLVHRSAGFRYLREPTGSSCVSRRRAKGFEEEVRAGTKVADIKRCSETRCQRAQPARFGAAFIGRRSRVQKRNYTSYVHAQVEMHAIRRVPCCAPSKISLIRRIRRRDGGDLCEGARPRFIRWGVSCRECERCDDRLGA
jgi:hypothetical protein